MNLLIAQDHFAEQVETLITVKDHAWALRALIRTQYEMASCIGSSVGISQVLAERFGIVSFPLVARITGFNPPMARAFEQWGWPIPDHVIEELRKDEQNPPKMSMIGYPDPTSNERMGQVKPRTESWIGHLVAVALVADQWFLIDLSIDQINQSVGFTCEPSVVTVDPDFVTGKQSALVDNGGSILVYEGFPHEQTYMGSADYDLFRTISGDVFDLMVSYLERCLGGHENE